MKIQRIWLIFYQKIGFNFGRERLQNKPQNWINMKSLSVALLGIFVFSASADPDSKNILRKLSSKAFSDRMEGLKDLRHTADKTLHQKLIQIALMDLKPEARAQAVNTLNNLMIMDTVPGEAETLTYDTTYRADLQKLQAAISSAVPEERIKTLNALKNLENLHPAALYTLIKDVVLQPSVDSEVVRELMRLAISSSYFQKWLMSIALSDVISKPIRGTAIDILIGIKPDLEYQRELVRVVTSDKVSYNARKTAKKILIKTRLYPEVQMELVRLAVSDEVSFNASYIAKTILKRHKPDMVLAELAMTQVIGTPAAAYRVDALFSVNLYPEVQMELVRIIVDQETSGKARAKATDILFAPINLTETMRTRFFWNETQEELERIAFFRSTSVPEEARKISEDVLGYIRNIGIVDTEAENKMSFPSKCSRAFRGLWLKWLGQ